MGELYQVASVGLGLALWAAARRGRLRFRFGGTVRPLLLGAAVAVAGPTELEATVTGIRTEGLAGFAVTATLVVGVAWVVHDRLRGRFPLIGRFLMPALILALLAPWWVGVVAAPVASLVPSSLVLVALVLIYRITITGRIR